MPDAGRVSRRTRWQQIFRARKKVPPTRLLVAREYPDACQFRLLPPTHHAFRPVSTTARRSARGAAQAEVVALEEHVSALQQQLEQSELDCVHKKAQIDTLARLADVAPAAVRPAQDPGAAAAEPSDPLIPAAAAQPRPDAMRISAFKFSQVCAGSSRKHGTEPDAVCQGPHRSGGKLVLA